jgi:hypothetical protein
MLVLAAVVAGRGEALAARFDRRLRHHASLTIAG